MKQFKKTKSQEKARDNIENPAISNTLQIITTYLFLNVMIGFEIGL